MTPSDRLVPVGRVGRAHGLDGSFYVTSPSHELPEGMTLSVAGKSVQIERRAGTADRPLIRLSGVTDRDRVAELAGEQLLADIADAPLEGDEWLAADLVGCEIPGVGTVTRVVAGPSCDVLEVDPGGTLIPFISDAVKNIDLEGRRIEVNREFLGLDAAPEAP